MIGGGIELALACDIRVATDDISFGFFRMQRGMHFGDGGIVRLVNTCGVGIAMELELMGEPITAQRALECHLVNRIVPRTELMSTVEDMAAKIMREPADRGGVGQETILDVVGRPLDEPLQIECLNSYSIMNDPEIVGRRTPSSNAARVSAVAELPVRVGVNLMVPHGVPDAPVRSGKAPLAHQDLLLDRMAAAGLDHVMVGDHVVSTAGSGTTG